MNDNEEQQLEQNRIRWNRIFDMNAVDRTIRIIYVESLSGESLDGHVSVTIYKFLSINRL